jgi:hypothetical protein
MPRDVLVRGSFVVRDGTLVAEPGDGRFLRRARFREPSAAAAAVTV